MPSTVLGISTDLADLEFIPEHKINMNTGLISQVKQLRHGELKSFV